MDEYIEREAIKYEQWAVGPLNEPLMVVRKETIDRIPAADVARFGMGGGIGCGQVIGHQYTSAQNVSGESQWLATEVRHTNGLLTCTLIATAAQKWIRMWKEMGKKFIGPKEKSLGKRMCRVMTGHRPRKKWGQHDHYGKMLYYYQCKRCGHLFWTTEVPDK